MKRRTTDLACNKTRLCEVRLWMVGLCMILSIALRAPFAQAASSDDRRPNILFIIFDDWGWNHSGAYGCTWVDTPNFDRLAREGVRFTHAFTSNPKCSPCRASILTGRNAWQLEEGACHNGVFPAKFAVYPDLLEQAGYVVGLTGKGWGPGDFKAAGFRRNPAGPAFDEHKAPAPATGINRNDYARNFETFLKQRPADRPFCFWMGFSEPHRPYELGSGERLGKRLADVNTPAYLPSVDVVRRDMLDYAAEVQHADAHIGRAIEALRAAGELDRTLIVATSDHGMPFPRVKGQIYEDGFRLPLAIRWGEAIKPGRVVEDFVNVRDFAPTFMELAGLQPHAQMTGSSLVDLLTAPESGWIDRNRNVMLVGKERHDLGRPFDWGYPVRAIRTTEYLYVRNYFPDRWPAGNPETDFGNCDGSPTKELLKRIRGDYYDWSFGKRPPEELFRIADDPACLVNLANDPSHAAIAADMQQQMLARLRDEQDPRTLGNGNVFDGYQYVGKRGHSYAAWLRSQKPAAAGSAE